MGLSRKDGPSETAKDISATFSAMFLRQRIPKGSQMYRLYRRKCPLRNIVRESWMNNYLLCSKKTNASSIFPSQIILFIRAPKWQSSHLQLRVERFCSPTTVESRNSNVSAADLTGNLADVDIVPYTLYPVTTYESQPRVWEM